MLLKNNSYSTEKTAPTQLDFFGRFAPLLPALNASQRLLGIASGVLSGIVIAYIVYTQLPPTLPANIARLAMAASFVLGFIIFDGFYIYIAETVFRSVRDGSAKNMKFITICLALTGMVIFALDFVNSTKAGEILGGKTAERPPLQQTDSLITRHIAQTQTISAAVGTEAQLISQSLQNQIAAKESAAQAKIAAKEAQKNQYAQLASTGNQWANSQIAKINRSIAAIHAQKAKQIATLQQSAAKKTDKASADTKSAINLLNEQNAESIRIMNTYNDMRVSQYKNEYLKFSSLGWLISVFLTVAPTLVTFLKVLIEVGSGITISTQVRRRGLVAIIQNHWQNAKEWFYNLIDPEGQALFQAALQKHTSQYANTPETSINNAAADDVNTNADADTTPDAHTNTPHKQPTIGYFVPNEGFLNDAKLPENAQNTTLDDCRNCQLPPPPANTVITDTHTVITTPQNGQYIADIARISAAIKALMSKLRHGQGAPKSNAARIAYLCIMLNQAAKTNAPVTVQKRTPEQYKKQAEHIASTKEAIEFLVQLYPETLNAIGEGRP